MWISFKARNPEYERLTMRAKALFDPAECEVVTHTTLIDRLVRYGDVFEIVLRGKQEAL